MEAWGLTDTGNVREENQDFYRMERLGPETLLAVVCDGMGGALAGNVASRLACEVFCGEERSDVAISGRHPRSVLAAVKTVLAPRFVIARRPEADVAISQYSLG